MEPGNEERPPQPPSRFSGLKRIFGRRETPPSSLAEPVRPPLIENGGKIEGVATDQNCCNSFIN